MKNLFPQLTRESAEKWKRNTKKFLKPVILLYCGQVILLITNNNGIVNPQFLIPTAFTIGAMTLYVFNVIFDIVSKWDEDQKK